MMAVYLYNTFIIYEGIEMKVTELKKILADADNDLLKKSIVEVYKLLPTSKKDEADCVIMNILGCETGKQEGGISEAEFNKLRDEINEFLSDAYARYYFIPNRIIPKKERPKWRFLIKKYVKELDKISNDSPFYREATQMLIDIYKLMCHGCNYYIFSSTNPFKSSGISQYELYNMFAKRLLSGEYNDDELLDLIVCASSGGLSDTSLYFSQQTALVGNLKTPSELYNLLNLTKNLVEGKTEIKGVNNKGLDSYVYEENINNLCDLALITQIKLNQYDEGIEYFFKNCRYYDKEIILYHGLDVISWFTDDDKDLWLKFYDYGVKKRKIKPREDLLEEYKEKTKA